MAINLIGPSKCGAIKAIVKGATARCVSFGYNKSINFTYFTYLIFSNDNADNCAFVT